MSSFSAMASSNEAGGQKRFSGDALDPREYRRWRLWVEAKMAAVKDFQATQRGPYVFCLLDGVALEAVEHLTLDQLKESNGDKHIWAALDERIPDKLQHDWLAECLQEIFKLEMKEGESMLTWTSRVQESFSKCQRKVDIKFPTEARGWICLHNSSLGEDQRAIVTAKTQGKLDFETVVGAMRSCFPDFRAPTKSTRSRSATVYVAQKEDDEENELNLSANQEEEGPDAFQMPEIESFLAEHGLSDAAQSSSGDVFEEAEVAEVLAATWKEKRTEIARLQKTRKFQQASSMKKQFSRDVSELQRKSRCRKCNQIGHWARNCPQNASSDKVHGAAMVTEEVLLVSSPGFGIIDSGCSRTLIGQDTLNQFMRLYHERQIEIPEEKRQTNLFRFGNGQEELSERVVSMPVVIHGKQGRIEAAIIKGNAPLLLSRNTLRSLKAVLHFADETLALDGQSPRPLQTNSAGQFVINVLDTCETLVVDNEQMPDKLGQLTRRERRCIEAQSQSWKKGTSRCAVAELFSPPRFSRFAAEKGEHGLSFDIKQGWDLLKSSTQQTVDRMLDEESPELLICCPECKHWGGWYRLNQHFLPMEEQIHNKRVAQKQADFCVQQIKKQLKRGGRVLVEHPWTSALWSYPPMRKLISKGLLTVHRADMCAYGLHDAQNQMPILKPTGLAISHADMEECVCRCPGHERHQIIAGRSIQGLSRSAMCAEYTPKFVHTWFSCIRPSLRLCHFASLQEPTSAEHDHEPASRIDADHESSNVDMPTQEKQALETFVAEVDNLPDEKVMVQVRKLHNNLGHPSSRTLLRILKHAGGSEQAMRLAGRVEAECEICINRQRPTPALPVNPESFQDFNHRVGWDVKLFPGWKQNQRVKCMNVIDYASSFQVVLPFYEAETSEVLKRLYLEGWQRWAGTPVEVIVDPARTNAAKEVFDTLEHDGARVLTTAAEAHSQLGKVEKHGHLFEVVLQKVIDQVQPRSREEYEQCIIQTANAKNELLNQKGLSPCQLVFGRNPRIAGDLLQETPCPVAGTTPLHDPVAARAQTIRSQARLALVMAQDDSSLRTALNARPRVEREFLPGDYVAYWRSQKYERGARLVGGRWFGTAVIMGRVGRNFLVYHRRNMFKVSPEHLRHASTEERMLAQSDGREMLGLSAMLQDRAQLGSQYTDLTQQIGPPDPANPQTNQDEHTSRPPLSVVDYWLMRGDLLVRMHVVPRKTTFMPQVGDPVLEGKTLDDWRLTIPRGSGEQFCHRPWSEPSCHEVNIEGCAEWTGETHFRIRPKRETARAEARPVSTSPGAPTVAPAAGSSDAVENSQATENRWSPFPVQATPEPSVPGGYGPVRLRLHDKGPQTYWFRPPETSQDDLQELLVDNHGTKRAHSPDKGEEPEAKSSRAETCLIAQLVDDTGQDTSIECLLAGFLKKQMQKELHHSNNPPELQEKIDQSKTVEWMTLRDEKEALMVIPPSQARRIRETKPDRIMTSRFVVVEKHEDGESKIKSRWCLRGHHDPDLVQKVLAGKCHSPTLTQFGRSLILQLIVSNQWTMHLGDIKGAFLEADVKEKARRNPVYAELPPGGVPGVEKGSLVQILGNIYGANDAPHEWYCEFDSVAQAVGFTRSKFDSCLYLCHGEHGRLEGILGAHVDDTITGGEGPKYTEAIRLLRERFPFRKWRSGRGEFLGTIYEQCPQSFEITFQQAEYAEHITPIRVSKERAKRHWLPANEREVAALRAVNGSLSWLATQSRPDIAVQTSISQQCFPRPSVFDLLQANQAVRRAKQQADLKIKVPYIPLDELTVCFWSDAAFANSSELKTQGGWLVAFTSTKIKQGEDVPVFCFSWKSYRLPRVVSSTMGGEAQAFATASGVCEWLCLMLAECIDGPFSLRDLDQVLLRRNPVGISDCRSLYDHLTSLNGGGTLDDKRTAIDIAIIRQSIKRTNLEPRWCPTGHMVADGLTKDKAEPADLLRSVLRNARYQLADEQLVLERKKKERERRRQRGAVRAKQTETSKAV